MTIRRRLVVLALALSLGLSPLAGSAPTAAAGGPLRYLGGAPGTYDPAFIADANDVQLLLQLYAGLTRLDERGEPYPSLARSWDVSADGRTYTFHLRDGVRFSDGSALTAADVRRSWLRLLDPTTHATAPDVLAVIDGAPERIAGGSEAAVGIQAPDPRTLVVRLRHPASYFPSITATPATFVVPRTANATRDWQQPDAFVGSGPYGVAAASATQITLRANPQYAGAPPPIAEVDWLTDTQDDPVTLFADDKLDLVNIGSADAGWIAYDRALGPDLHRAAALNVEYFGFDVTRPPFDDARVRRAFALALDRSRLVELAAGTSALAAASIVPPALQPGNGFHVPAANVDEAKRLLDQAGYADRSKLGTITVNGTALDVGPAVETWREALGARIEVETMDFDAYLRQLDTDVPQVFTINWIADYPSPHALYSLLLQPDAASNYGHWRDDAFVTLLEAAAAAKDDAARAAAYRAVDERVADQAPLIPWSYDESWWLTRRGLRGLGDLTVGLLDFGLVSWPS